MERILSLLRRLAQFLGGLGLACPHLGIEPPAAQQFVVAALFGQAALIEHQDTVGIGDGREPVGDGERGDPVLTR